ncbi:hypothetical protein MHH33_00870 [Paenisporosarcina sp. FSL H8-0542]|uniref:hypothetical protein n=1 Tax=Paenisporosarcina sp. FSL H8-0542 TaxID=2921401 RepID=UPI00315ADF07
MRKKILVTMMLSVVFCLFSLSIVPTTSYACSCAQPPSVEDELERSQAVFSGKVLEVKVQKNFKGYVKKRVLIEVAETWKGVSESQVIITTGSGGGDCGYEFQVGQEYLVYATESTMYGDKAELVTVICDRTTELSAAQEDLTVLGEGKEPTEQVDLVTEQAGIAESNAMIAVIVAVGIVLLSFIVWKRFKKR